MLHIKVDLIPGGYEAARQTLTELYIGNDGTGDRHTGHYDVYTADPRRQPKPREARQGWIGRIEDFDRGEGRDALAAAALRLATAKERAETSCPSPSKSSASSSRSGETARSSSGCSSLPSSFSKKGDKGGEAA